MNPSGPKSNINPRTTTIGGNTNGMVNNVSKYCFPLNEYRANMYAPGNPRIIVKKVLRIAWFSVNRIIH
jgi:hypothetical protein